MNLEQFPNSQTAKNMMSYISLGFYDHSYVGKWLFEVMGMELDGAREKLEELPLQAFPETATWALRYHEEKYGLPVREDLPEEERRKLIFQRRDLQAPVTPYAMEEMLKNVTEFEVYISDCHDVAAYVPKPVHPNVFDVVLIGEGTVAVKRIRELLNKVKQSHTDYQIRYYEHAEYEVPILYENAVHFQSDFHPRYNLPYLLLNNTWRLDGNRRLTGYDSDDYLDFYPVCVTIQTGAAQELQAEASNIRVTWEGEEAVKIGSGLEMKTEAVQNIRTEERTKIQTGAAYEVDTASCMTKMNQMDGTWKMDGSRKLDGGLYIL